MELHHIAAREGPLSSFLRREMKMSSGLVNRLKWQGALYVNGISRHTNFPVVPGDSITVTMAEPEPEYPAEEGPLSVLYEDEAILVVDKPSGMLIHPSRTRTEGTLANRVIWYYQQTGQNSAFHPITRLDRDTFGIVLLAKNSHIHSRMQHSDLQKTYHALAFGTPEAPRGIIDAPIARLPLPSLLREVRSDGKPSRTEYRVLEASSELCKLELKPITGRTHQLRVHCAYIGHPILGDPQYGSPESQAFSRCLGLESQILCAKVLEFTHPLTGRHMVLESGLEARLPQKAE